MQMYKPKPGETVNQMKVLSDLVKEMGIRGMYTGKSSLWRARTLFHVYLVIIVCAYFLFVGTKK